MKKKLNLIVGSVLVLIIIVLGIVLVSKSSSLKTQTALTKKEKLQKDSLQTVLNNQVIAEEEAKVLAEQQAEAKKNLLQSTGLSNLQLPGIYWEWGADSASIAEGIKTFKLYDAERDNYPDYRFRLQSLTQKTFGGSWEQSRNRSNSLVDLFVKVPTLFKVIYDLNKGIVSSLKTSWGLPNQGEELAKYLGSQRYPYDGDFESYFQKHVKDSLPVFSGQGWQDFYNLCHTKYPEIFKSENDLKREYGNWRVVRANFSTEAKGVLLYVFTDYNGGAAAQPATTGGTTTKKQKSISDWFK